MKELYFTRTPTPLSLALFRLQVLTCCFGVLDFSLSCTCVSETDCPSVTSRLSALLSPQWTRCV